MCRPRHRGNAREILAVLVWPGACQGRMHATSPRHRFSRPRDPCLGARPRRLHPRDGPLCLGLCRSGGGHPRLPLPRFRWTGRSQWASRRSSCRPRGRPGAPRRRRSRPRAVYQYQPPPPGVRVRPAGASLWLRAGAGPRYGTPELRRLAARARPPGRRRGRLRGRAADAYGLGGAGLGLRYRATPHFGLELGADVLGGPDYNGNKRLEVSGNLGGLLYVNPRSRAQFYLSGGLLVDHATRHRATESSDRSSPPAPRGPRTTTWAATAASAWRCSPPAASPSTSTLAASSGRPSAATRPSSPTRRPAAPPTPPPAWSAAAGMVFYF